MFFSLDLKYTSEVDLCQKLTDVVTPRLYRIIHMEKIHFGFEKESIARLIIEKLDIKRDE